MVDEVLRSIPVNVSFGWEISSMNGKMVHGTTGLVWMCLIVVHNCCVHMFSIRLLVN
jgi:hypothetical protein